MIWSPTWTARDCASASEVGKPLRGLYKLRSWLDNLCDRDYQSICRVKRGRGEGTHTGTVDGTELRRTAANRQQCGQHRRATQPGEGGKARADKSKGEACGMAAACKAQSNIHLPYPRLPARSPRRSPPPYAGGGIPPQYGPGCPYPAGGPPPPYRGGPAGP